MNVHSDRPERRVVVAVGQQVFESYGGDSGYAHVFCTLVPVVFEDGSGAGGADQFPNNGLVWWKLRAASRSHAQPGRLLVASLEPAPQYFPGDPTKQYWQAVPHDIEPVGPESAMEIVAVADRAVKRPRDLVNVPGVAEMDHPPAYRVLVRWSGGLYGPLEAKIAASAGGLHRVSFAAPAGESTMTQIPEAALEEIGRHHWRGEVRVSLDDLPVYRSGAVSSCRYELVLGDGYDMLRRSAVGEVDVFRDDELIGRAARRLLTRRDRQQLASLLEKLREMLEDSPEDVEAFDLIDATRRRAQLGDARLGELARALLDAGILDDRIEQALEDRAREHVESNAAVLAAEINDRLAAARTALEELERRREDLDASIEGRERQARLDLENRIADSWREHQAELERERERLDRQRGEFEAHAGRLTDRLAAAGSRFAEGRDLLIDDFLALLPLLRQVVPEVARSAEPGEAAASPAAVPGPPGHGRPDSMSRTRGADIPAEPVPAPVRSFRLPGWLTAGDTGSEPQPAESEFFDRFASHVQQSGFEYRTIDLQSFHLGMKCCDVTVIAGAPGTGKSSLPRLYAEALAGDETVGLDEREGGRYLYVPIHRSWVDLTDLIGQANVLEHTFEPAPTGLFETLVCAAEEYAARGTDCGVYGVCLDDLDLASADSLLAGLIQTMQRPEPLRILRCFDRHSVRPDDPFHRWHSLPLPRSLRLVATLPDDRAAARSGTQLLDRAWVVRLVPARSRELPPAGPASPPAGAPVRLRTYQRWVRDAALPASQAATLDRLESPLNAIGAPLTPRRLRRLRRVVASAVELFGGDVAFDLQLAQRVLARDDSRFGAEVEEAARQALDVVEPDGDRFPETLSALESVLDENASG